MQNPKVKEVALEFISCLCNHSGHVWTLGYVKHITIIIVALSILLKRTSTFNLLVNLYFYCKFTYTPV